MTIKDVIKITATYLNRQRIISAIDSIEEENMQTTGEADANSIINDLTRCANLVINELALSYIPMIKTEKAVIKDGKIYYADLTETPIKVLEVLDSNKNAVSTIFHHEYLLAKGDNLLIKYRYLPTNYGLTEKIGFERAKLLERIIAYGVCAEYCLILKAFDESVMWHKRYMDALAEILTPKNSVIKKRAWL